MKFQIGDQVAFLNEKQSGTVVRQLEGKMILVAIEDGFEIPVSENELVLVRSNTEKKHIQPEKQVPELNLSDALLVCPDQSAMLVAVPTNSSAVLTGPVSYLLINRTGYKLLYTVHVNMQQVSKGISSGTCDHAAAVLLFESERKDLVGIRSIMIRVLMFREQGWSHADYMRKEIPVLLPGIESSNQDYPANFMFAKSIIIYSQEPAEEQNLKELVEKYKPAPSTTQPTGSGKQSTTGSSLREVDLHIEELVSDLEGLSHSDMLQIQMKQFFKTMDDAIRNRVQRIVFIHGVGSGTLKNEIRRELSNYKGITFRDAEVSKYGRGATEVILVHF